jgi:hypothetical protein
MIVACKPMPAQKQRVAVATLQKQPDAEKPLESEPPQVVNVTTIAFAKSSRRREASQGARAEHRIVDEIRERRPLPP